MIEKSELIRLNKTSTCAEIARELNYTHKQVSSMFIKYGIKPNKHIYTIPRDTLYDLHITKRLNLIQIKEMLDIDISTIRRLLTEHGIEYINYKQSPIDLETLKSMYSNNYELSEISIKLGRSVSYINNQIKKHGITRLDKLHTFTKEHAIFLYQTKNKSIIDIAKMYKISIDKIKNLLIKYDIPLKRDIKILSKHDIELCLNTHMSLEAIRLELNCTLYTLQYNMKIYGLSASKYRKYKITKNELVKLHHIDKKSLSDISELIGCHKTTIPNICRSVGVDIKRHVITSNHRKIKELLDSYGIVYVDNTRTIIPPLELDIYIPELKLAIELNGIYWHSEKFKPKNYHYEKYLKCKEFGIQLIQIWEDDFNLNKSKILKFIQYKLGFNEGRVFARKCSVINVNKNIVNNFHDANHIQNRCPTTFSIGLEFDKKLVAVCSFKRTLDKLDLVRYSTSTNVVGGFTKILSYVIKNIEFKEIITFADLCISDGKLYDIAGFKVDLILLPDYKYVIGSTRKHKFGYRKKTFKNNINLLYYSYMNERELAKLNGLYRIYDAGKIRYKLVNPRL